MAQSNQDLGESNFVQTFRTVAAELERDVANVDASPFIWYAGVACLEFLRIEGFGHIFGTWDADVQKEKWQAQNFIEESLPLAEDGDSTAELVRKSQVLLRLLDISDLTFYYMIRCIWLASFPLVPVGVAFGSTSALEAWIGSMETYLELQCPFRDSVDGKAKANVLLSLSLSLSLSLTHLYTTLLSFVQHHSRTSSLF